MRALDALGAGDWLVWLRRTGDLDAEDGDCAWLAAARAAFAAHDSALGCFHVVTRHGWHELISGHREEWLRPRSHQV
ncbi:MAG: hypothetical protein EOO74_01750 [Myxococcales bacterium]|nr:MAG: hypothetical protein EOO74_01750 [Myxococcales bacterium]